MRVAIIGQGYVGTSLGHAAYASGHSVIGIEINAEKLKNLQNQEYPVSNDFSSIANCEVVILAVPTPLKTDRSPDISHLVAACESIREFIGERTLIINESTSYPGTLRNLVQKLIGDQHLYVAAPERVDPGNNKWNLFNTPRILGALSEEALRLGADFYRKIGAELVTVSSPEVAEAAKLFENTFRQVNIALVNEFAQISNSLGISTYEVLEAANTKPYGIMKFLPSVGVGGHCIPVDPIYLSHMAAENGMEARFISLANQINQSMPLYLANRISDEFGISGKKIQIAGISYKSNIADTRESPAWELIKILRSRNADVIWHDEIVRQHEGESSVPIQRVDIGIICTAHGRVDYSAWANSQTAIIDLSISNELGFPKFL